MEPEKKDVWEAEFDSHWEKIMPKDRVSAIVGSQVKNFIRQNFIPRADVVEKAKRVKYDLGNLPMYKEKYRFAYQTANEKVDDLLTLLTQEK